jgi:hypothetical protein
MPITGGGTSPGRRPKIVSSPFAWLTQHATALWVVASVCAGSVVTSITMRWRNFRRHADDVALWVLVANMNTLLRLDLDHLSGDDDNFALREARTALKELAAARPLPERKLLDHFNALAGIAVAFGERVHNEHGVVNMHAVVNRRAHVQNALAIGDQIEAALGGLAELARCGNVDRRERLRQSYQRTEAAEVG